MILILMTFISYQVQSQSPIASFLKEDQRLGGIRNHDPETMPLHRAIERYVAALRDLDHDVPDAFMQAFEAHLQAWERMADYTRDHSEMRGEIHDLFDQLEQASNPSADRFKRLLEEIWSTWRQVEAVAKTHGVEP